MFPPESETDRWFSENVLLHEPALRAWLRARFPSLTDRDDLIQESYLRLLRARATTPIESARAFLFTTARNLALNQLRHRKHSHPETIGELDASVVLDQGTSIPECVTRNQEITFLNEAIQSLPKRCREVFVLRRLQGLSQKDVAARLGISERTVEAHTLIALRKCVEFFRQTEGSAVARSARARLVKLQLDEPLGGQVIHHA